jgi:hypothetical protein
VVVAYAEQADVDSVFVAGKALKRHGKMLYPEAKMRTLRDRLRASRERIMHS